ncbi:MAG: serine hydrolase [Planctomycetota bacterium]
MSHIQRFRRSRVLGLAFLAGLILSHPSNAQQDEESTVSSAPDAPITRIDVELQRTIGPLVKQHRGDVAVAIRNLETGEQYQFNATTPMPTASLIKLPILVTAYQLSDRGALNLREQVQLKEEDKVPGSGILTDHFSTGASLPVEDYLRLMVRYSDNTATNVVIDQIGIASTTKAMEALRLNQTKLHSKVYRRDTTISPERSRLFGIGSTTAKEMVDLLSSFHSGELLTKASTSAVIEHLLSCDDGSKLAAELPPGTWFAHKTGAISNCRTDAGIIRTPRGAVAVCFLTNRNEDQRWADNNEANRLAAKIGAAIVERFGRVEIDQRLRKGSFGTLVEALQRTLNDRLDPSPELAIDGDFGPATLEALMRFQASRNLSTTGVVDEATWKALGTLLDRENPVADPQVINAQRLSLRSAPAESDPPVVTCEAWTIIDRETGEALFSFNEDATLHPASTTKIMTAFVVLRLADDNPQVLEERIQFSRRADQTRGSTSAIRTGESITVREALYGLLLPSGNDASVALAEHFGARLTDKSDPDSACRYDQFVAAMNRTARQIGMRRTRYVNTHGLTDERHQTSAGDLARLAREAMQHALFCEIVATRQYGCVATGEQGYQRNIFWKNTNQLLGIEGYQGIKTGTTSAAGACLVTAGERNGRPLIAVVLGSKSSSARYADTRNLMRWAWQRLGDTTVGKTPAD